MIHIVEKKIELTNVSCLIDFGRDAYANLEIETNLLRETELEIVLGEVLTSDGAIHREPGGFRIIRTMRKHCPAGKTCFRFELPRHKSPYSHTISVPTPPEAEGEVVPFRYVEISGGEGYAVFRRRELFDEFDDGAASFESSDDRLNQVWELCKYTMKATGAFGIYIDGERERKPYEGDAFINQLGAFCCDRNFSVAKKTIEYFLNAPTYPTEWQLLTPMLAHDYLLYSGDTESVKAWLPVLKERALLQIAGEDALVRPTEEIRDIVDWPACERDGYEFGDVNLVPNCYHYGALRTLEKLTGDDFFRDRAALVKKSIYARMFRNGLFVDHPNSAHTSLHSAVFPLYFDLADDPGPLKNIIAAKGMACSVYGAHFLLDACFRYGMADHAFGLMTASGPRGWLHMIEQGATITMEAWDNSFKPNQDWNHAWGAAPANIIPRFIGGIRPLEPGFRKFLVDPQPCGLMSFELKTPTPHGEIILKLSKNGKLFLSVPPGVTAIFHRTELPTGKHHIVLPESCP